MLVTNGVCVHGQVSSEFSREIVVVTMMNDINDRSVEAKAR